MLVWLGGARVRVRRPRGEFVESLCMCRNAGGHL